MKPEQEAKIIREQLAFIGRYLDGISPKVAKYAELQEEKSKLRKRLKEIGKKHKDAGSNPEPMRKKFTNFRDIVTPIIGEKNVVHSIHPLTKKSY